MSDRSERPIPQVERRQQSELFGARLFAVKV